MLASELAATAAAKAVVVVARAISTAPAGAEVAAGVGSVGATDDAAADGAYDGDADASGVDDTACAAALTLLFPLPNAVANQSPVADCDVFVFGAAAGNCDGVVADAGWGED